MVSKRVARAIPKCVVTGLLCAVTSMGCKPDLQGRPSLIDSPRVVALRSKAAEVKPEESVNYDVLLASPIDSTEEPTYQWSLCTARKPLAESGPIAESCLAPAGPDLQDLGNSPSVDGAVIPKDVCQVFGPETPTQKTGEPALRPVDPDTTGGYYQPVRLLTQFSSNDSQYDVGVTRLLCKLAAGANQQQAAQFTRDYRPNQNPNIQQIAVTRPSGETTVVDTAAEPASVTHGERLNFEITWPICPLTANCGDNICSAGEDLTNCPSDCQNFQGCEGSEPYLSYDTVTQSLLNRRESIRISWYATDGNFEHDRTGRAESEADQPNSSNTWTAPDNAKIVRFWLVIRDDRRGVNWATFDMQIQ